MAALHQKRTFHNRSKRARRLAFQVQGSPYGSRLGPQNFTNRTPHTTNPNTSGIDDPITLSRNTTVLESVPIEQLVARSTIEIAQTLTANKSRWRLQYLSRLSPLISANEQLSCSEMAGFRA